MPRAPRLCARCRSIATRGSYCDGCRPEPFEGARDRWRAQKPANWNQLRRQVIRRDLGKCAECGAPANQVDHIRGVASEGDWSLGNLQLLCTDHHKNKTSREAAEGRRRAQALRRRR